MAVVVPVVVPMAVGIGLFFIIAMCLKREKWVCFWLFFTAFIQLVMEFNFGLNHHFVKERSKLMFSEFLMSPVDIADLLDYKWWTVTFYGQYTKYDTRYANSDPTIVALSVSQLPEAIFCYLCIYLIQTGSRWRHPLQLLAAAWQFYGTFIYFAVPYISGTWNTVFDCSTTEFLTYVVGLNGLWFVVPGVLMVQSLLAIASGKLGGNNTAPAKVANGKAKAKQH